jgi:RNA-directed DNA polymerase
MREPLATYAWRTRPWCRLEVAVLKLQRRIYKASRAGAVRRVHRLQRLLMKSRAAKLLAVGRVTQDNRGEYTAGIDGVKSLRPPQRLAQAERLGKLPTGSPTEPVWILSRIPAKGLIRHFDEAWRVRAYASASAHQV